MAEFLEIRHNGSMISKIVNGSAKKDRRLETENGSYANLSTLTSRVNFELGQIFPLCGQTAKIYGLIPYWGNFSVAGKIIIKATSF